MIATSSRQEAAVAVRAYVLIQTESGEAASATGAVRDLRYPGLRVLSVDATIGPYDVIALLETDDLDRLGEAIVDALQTLAGIRHAVTCLAVHLA